MREKTEYLGDGVYAIFDGLGIWLYANHHENPTDRIYLEPNVFQALNLFYNDVRENPNLLTKEKENEN